VRLSREGFREYAGGALWVWPSLASQAALILGLAISQITISPQSPLAPLAFQGPETMREHCLRLSHSSSA
jgi:hypothetical protein